MGLVFGIWHRFTILKGIPLSVYIAKGEQHVVFPPVHTASNGLDIPSGGKMGQIFRQGIFFKNALHNIGITFFISTLYIAATVTDDFIGIVFQIRQKNDKMFRGNGAYDLSVFFQHFL